MTGILSILWKVKSRNLRKAKKWGRKRREELWVPEVEKVTTSSSAKGSHLLEWEAHVRREASFYIDRRKVRGSRDEERNVM
jgi:hypothetical protein